MKRITLIMLTLVATCVLSGTMASTSMGRLCVTVEEANTGDFNNKQCEGKKEPGNYVQIKGLTTHIEKSQWCAVTWQEQVGNFKDPECSLLGKEGDYIKVQLVPLVWHVNGSQLKQGAKQIKLQLKGSAVLKSPGVGAEIECKNSISEGSTIEGAGKLQGQDKGRVTYSQCKMLKPAKAECTVAEPITTKQLKSYLAYANTQTNVADVYEPTEGTLFVTLKFSKGCGTVLEGERGVNGSVAAEVIPSETEGQEGLTAFPATAISSVIYEGQEKKIKLEAIGVASTFSAAYGARLESGEQFGVFNH